MDVRGSYSMGYSALGLVVHIPPRSVPQTEKIFEKNPDIPD